MTEFKSGDKVKVKARGGEEYTIEFGPYGSVSGPSYLVKDAAGNCHPCTAAFLSAVPPEDPKVEVVAKTLYECHYGAGSWVLTLKSKHDDYRDDARAILAALAAMPKDEKPAPRRVLDEGGDVWERNAEGLWDCMTTGLVGGGEFTNRSYEWIDREYGPLTDV